MTKRQKTGLLVLLSPFIAWIIIFILQVFSRIIGGPLSEPNIFERFVNIFSIILGAFAVLGFLPALIVGIVLLATPGKN